VPRYNHMECATHAVPNNADAAVDNTDCDEGARADVHHMGDDVEETPASVLNMEDGPNKIQSASGRNRPLWLWMQRWFRRKKAVGAQGKAPLKTGKSCFPRLSMTSCLCQCRRSSFTGHDGKNYSSKINGHHRSTDESVDCALQREGSSVFDSVQHCQEHDVLSNGNSTKQRQGTMVVINLYELSPAFAFVNRNFLLPSKLGIFHVAVEAYNLEWSFAYRGPQDQMTGVVQCSPRRLRSYVFRESLKVGWCDLDEKNFKKEVRSLCGQWRSNSYHLTRRNCLMFVEAFIERIGLGHQFPEWLKTVYTVSHNSPALSRLVDGTWELSKWWITSNSNSRNVRPTGSMQPVLGPQAWQLSCARCCSSRERPSMHELRLEPQARESYPATEDLDKLDRAV